MTKGDLPERRRGVEAGAPYLAYLANYDEYRTKGWKRIQNQGFAPDAILADDVSGRREDTRYGVTIVARPPASVRDVIRRIQVRLQRIDASQYFYPLGDSHLTVLEVFQGRSRMPDADQVRRINAAVRAASADTLAPRLIDGRIGFNESTVTLTCFPDDDRLDMLRDRIAAELSDAGIFREPRYLRKTAHVTFVRYISEVREISDWVESLRQAQAVVYPVVWEMNRVSVTSGATWYGRRERVEEHGPFALKKA